MRPCAIVTILFVNTFKAFETVARLLSWRPGQKMTSDYLYSLPSDRMDGLPTDFQLESLFQNADTFDIKPFKTVQENLYVLGPCTSLSQFSVEELVKPFNFMHAGVALAASICKDFNVNKNKIEHVSPSEFPESKIRQTWVPAPQRNSLVKSDSVVKQTELHGLRICELHQNLRGGQEGTQWLEHSPEQIPEWGTYQVIVIGGGTGGASAAIAAARQGKKTLLCEDAGGERRGQWVGC